MTKFTKEQLSAKAREQIAFCRNTKITGEGRAHVNQCSALFEIALAAMTAETVYQLINYDWYDTTKDVYESVVSAGGRGRIVYTAPPAPVVPDGYALVPVKPTEDMVIAGFEAELREEFRNPDAWETYEGMSGCEQAALRAKWCWAAMVAAVPKGAAK